MTRGAILAIDQGTTNTKAVLVDALSGKVLNIASTPMVVTYPQPGWAEQDAEAIWRAVQRVIADAIAGFDGEVAALGISNQRESIVLWDRQSGAPLGPVVTWQCRRSAARCEQIRRAGAEPEIVARTGLAIDPLFPAAKLAWVLDNVAGARDRASRGELCAGTIDSFLLFRLTAGAAFATDHSNASRTQLFNTETLSWDETLGNVFEVPLSLLPEVRPSDSRFGTLAAGISSLPAGTPICAMLGDSHAALFGHGVRRPGAVKATYGTGTSLMTIVPRRTASRSGLSGTIAWATANGVAYALEGNISVSGQAAAFMAEMLGLRSVSDLAALAATVPDSNGVTFVPALVGLGAPHWMPEARGLIDGLTLGTRPAHLARAAFEAIALQVADVFGAIEADMGGRLDMLLADGGGTSNGPLMQLQADLIDRAVVCPDKAELSAMGAATMAALAIGLDTTNWDKGEQTAFTPQTDAAAKRDLILAKWRRTLARTMLPAEPE